MKATRQLFGKSDGIVLSKRSIATVAIVAGIVVALLSFIAERALEVPKADFAWVDWADQLMAGVATAVCIYVVRNNVRRQELLNHQRFELISASTQQIRDALQLITDSAVPGTAQQRVVIYAVDHIEWVLEEVLPTVHQDPKEVQDRLQRHPAPIDESSFDNAAAEKEHDSPDSKLN
jgi:hypothetical protein